jgi:cell division protein YceG involved in septum cleavage
LGLPQAPHSTTTNPALSTSASSAASAQIYFVWDSSKGNSTGSDHLLTYKRYYNLVYVLRRSNLGLPQATHSTIISYPALSTSASSAASAQIYFVWDSSKGNSTGSDHLLTYKRYYNLVYVLRRSNLGLPLKPLYRM